MAHNCHIGNAAAQVQGDAMKTLFNSGTICIYDNTGATDQPATADGTLGTKVLLVTLTCSATAVATSVNGVLTFDTITGANAVATGTAYMYRCFKSDGTTPICDGLCGVTGSGSDMELNSLAITTGVAVSISSFTHTVTQ